MASKTDYTRSGPFLGSVKTLWIYSDPIVFDIPATRSLGLCVLNSHKMCREIELCFYIRSF